VEVFTSGVQGDLPEREGTLYHHLGNPAPPDFAVFAGLAFRERHQQKPFDVLECGELKAEGAWAARWVKDVAFVVRLHSPSVILNRYLDFPLTHWNYAKKIFFQLTVALGAWRRGLPLPPVYLEPFAFSWNQSADFEERAMAQTADMVLVMNEEMGRFASGAWGIARDAVKIRPNPFFPEDSKISASVSKQKVLGFIGRLEPRKGVLELAEALCQVLPDFPEWKVKIAGSSTGSCVSGTDPAAVVKKKLARFADQVEFQDRIEPSNVPDWLALVGLCVFPSIWETFSYVTLEAAQAGKAIIGTRTGAVPEILDEGQAGLIVPPGDVKELAEALRKLMADEELRAKLGAAAQRRFEERFNPDRVMGEILEVYREAIEWAKNRRKEV
jgi:glycosyltransferase involved in cell wall biosynthesis